MHSESYLDSNTIKRRTNEFFAEINWVDTLHQLLLDYFTAKSSSLRLNIGREGQSCGRQIGQAEGYSAESGKVAKAIFRRDVAGGCLAKTSGGYALRLVACDAATSRLESTQIARMKVPDLIRDGVLSPVCLFVKGDPF